MTIPRLHVVTDDDLLGVAGFRATAAALMEALGARVALHLRGPRCTTAALHELAAGLAPVGLRTGSLLLINDRVDVALAVRAGAHLRATSLPLTEARRLLHHAPLGYSAHSAEEAALAAAEGADYVFLGTIYATPSHPDLKPAGPALLARSAGSLEVPAIAIGGITVARVQEVRAAGAHGVAVIRGVWHAEDPIAAACAYAEALSEQSSEDR